MKEMFKSRIDVEMRMEKCPITIPTLHTHEYLVAIVVYELRNVYRVIYSVHVCL